MSRIRLLLSIALIGLFPATAHAEIVGGPLLTQGIIVKSAAGVPALPSTTAESYLIADAQTGEVLAAKNPHQQLPPASTLKTLTALSLLPRLDKSSTYVGQASDGKVDGQRAGVYPGRAYTVDSLFYALFLYSGNDAANALANSAGGLAQTLKYMRAEATRLQALDTVPKSPHGLDRPGQVSSAYDLALIARAALKRDDFRKYMGTKTYTFTGSGKANKSVEFINQNKLLFNYSGTIGMKTGYTTQGRNTYVGVATRNGHTLIVTLMHLPYGRDALATSLFNWGFKAIGKVEPVGNLVEPQSGSPRVEATAAYNDPKNVSTPAPTASKVITEKKSPEVFPSLPLGPLKWLLLPVLLVIGLRARVRYLMWRKARRRGLYQRTNPIAS